MLPFIIGGVVASVAAIGGVVSYFKYRSMKLGGFAIWGRPDSGKTTFYYQIRGKEVPIKKEATTSKNSEKDVVVSVGDEKYVIYEVTDLPGTQDRMPSWKVLIENNSHIFYLINLARADDYKYISNVTVDIEETCNFIKSKSLEKTVHLIGTHIDESRFKDIDLSQRHNEIFQDQTIRKIYETFENAKSGKVAGYTYIVNLTDRDDFKRLIESIVKDVK